MKIQNYSCGEWVDGTGQGQELLNASTGDIVGLASSEGLDFKLMIDYARKNGHQLRNWTFHQRARALKAMALYLLERKEKYYQLSYKTGATKVDSWIDIEGGIGNLFVYSSKGRREMPDTSFYVDGKAEILSKNGSFIGHHLYVPKEGVAIHINAFNFPVWGMLEKIAVNLLAGVPAIVKPATLSCYLTEAVFKDMIASKIFPEGSLQLICGSARGILDHVDSQDVVTFTGSAYTGRSLKSHPNIIEKSIPFNMEADSLNCSILGLDVTPDSPEFDIFIKEVAKEMTVKAGQKCTAIRRTIVPENLIEEVAKALSKRLEKISIGDPTLEGVRMGPLAGLEQLKEVREKVAELQAQCETLYQQTELNLIGGSQEKGAFLSPTILSAKNPLQDEKIHEIEAFGPVTTLMPYKTNEEAIILAKKGQGSLVGSLVTKDPKVAKEIVLGSASYHGRLLVLNSTCAKESTGHGSPMPQLVHGGPGRAGGGEEMGGLRGVFHYMQRTAIQGDPTTLSYITEVYQPGADRPEAEVHPFTKFFEELEIGETLTTHRRTITEADIVNFGNLSWDHFYAHTDETAIDDETFFEARVAHGYFIISAAAGLFVSPGKGPVLANYGLDELRFTKPVYVGQTIGVKLTVKEKIAQEDREDQIPRGVVKWQVEVTDQDGEICALATILTLVKKKPH